MVPARACSASPLSLGWLPSTVRRRLATARTAQHPRPPDSHGLFRRREGRRGRALPPLFDCGVLRALLGKASRRRERRDRFWQRLRLVWHSVLSIPSAGVLSQTGLVGMSLPRTPLSRLRDGACSLQPRQVDDAHPGERSNGGPRHHGPPLNRLAMRMSGLP